MRISRGLLRATSLTRMETHILSSKVPIFTEASLWSDSNYPAHGNVRCRVINRWDDAGGQRLVLVSTADPYDVEASDGETEFTVLESQLTEI